MLLLVEHPFDDYMLLRFRQTSSGLNGMHRVVAVHQGMGGGIGGRGGGEEGVSEGVSEGVDEDAREDADSAPTDEQLLLLSKLEMENKYVGIKNERV